jgi:hypothetical protein
VTAIDDRTPWTASDGLTVGLTSVIGLGLLLGAALGIRQTADPDTAVVLLNVAGAGLVVALAGNALFLLTGLRAVGVLRAGLLESAPAATAPESVPTGLLVASASMTRYHRDDCPAVRGKAVVPASAEGHVRSGRRPCGLCLEDAA